MRFSHTKRRYTYRPTVTCSIIVRLHRLWELACSIANADTCPLVAFGGLRWLMLVNIASYAAIDKRRSFKVTPSVVALAEVVVF